MRCPYCKHESTKVTETRERDATLTRRRRECLKCGKRFTTYESIASIDMIVVKKTGIKEPFSSAKLKDGIMQACNKRPVEEHQVDKVVEAIERHLRTRKGTEIPSRTIGGLVMTKLKKLDKVAYIRFTSVFRGFTDIDSFSEEVKKLQT